MSILEQYPKTFRNMTERLRTLLDRVPGVESREREDLARAINGMADKACDLNDIFQRLLEPTTPDELADLLIAFELTVEQIRGDSDTIDGKLYEMGDRLRGVELPGQNPD
jgi:hypothetical protein